MRLKTTKELLLYELQICYGYLVNITTCSQRAQLYSILFSWQNCRYQYMDDALQPLYLRANRSSFASFVFSYSFLPFKKYAPSFQTSSK